MGQYLFAIPPSDRFPAESLTRAQVVGLEGIPWTCATTIRNGILVITRHVDLSGRLLVPFPSRRHGQVYLTTATLPESAEPWPLDLELTRGSLSRLRNQLSIWEESGLAIPDAIHQQLKSLVEQYAAALFGEPPPEERTRACERVLDAVVELMFDLTEEFSRQVQAMTLESDDLVPVQLGTCGSRLPHHPNRVNSVELFVTLPPADPATRMIDVHGLAPVVEWAASPPPKGVRMIGPIMDFAAGSLPVWMESAQEFETRLARSRALCREIGRTYDGQLKLVHAVAGLSGVGTQQFNYPQQLQMTVEMLETLDRSLPNTSVLVSFDQPWGERLALANGGVSAMEVAETLLRYGARLSAFGLEFNLGYWPQGTLLRDPFQWVDLLDRWTQFGLPLIIYLSAPLGTAAELPTNRFAQTVDRQFLESSPAEYLNSVIELLKCRSAVNVIAWRYLNDEPESRFPLSGLLNAHGNLKPDAEAILPLLKSIDGSTSATP